MPGRFACIASLGVLLVPLVLGACKKKEATTNADEVAQADSLTPQDAETKSDSDPLGELTMIEGQGIRFAMPKLEEKVSEGELEAGYVLTMSQDEPGRFVHLGWERGPMPSDADLERFVELAPRFEEFSFGPGRLLPTRSKLRQTRTLVGSIEGTELGYALTSFKCPDDPRVFGLVSGLPLSDAEQVEQHERLLQTVECGPPPDLPPLFPEYRGPHSVQGYSDPQGIRGRIEGVAYVDLARVESSVRETLHADPAARAADLRDQGYVLEDAAAAVEPLPSDDADRRMWRVTLMRRNAMSAGEFEVVYGTLVCGRDSYVFSLRPIDRRIDDAVEAARRIECM